MKPQCPSYAQSHAKRHCGKGKEKRHCGKGKYPQTVQQ